MYLAFEYLEHDLGGLIESQGIELTEDHVGCYVKQLVSGAAYIHSLNVLHRDIKASNLLISSDGHLKIGDWGLARLQADNDGKQYYTNRVITLWYRPPELLLGSTKSADGYGTSADVWSIGCILAELLYAKPILPGNTEIEQLALIFELCGTPTVEDWPNVTNLPLWETFAPKDDVDDPGDDRPERKLRKLRDKFDSFERTALDLVDEILVYDPQKRISAHSALDRAYLRNAKRPEELDVIRISSAHEWEVRQSALNDSRRSESRRGRP